MLAHFEAPDTEAPGPSSTPIETVEALFEAAGHHFPEIEAQGRAGIAGVIARAAGMEDEASRTLAQDMLERYAQDAMRLPMDMILPAARGAGFDPGQLLMLGQGDVALVLRRLASLPPGSGAPDYGLAVCDAAGALLFRRRLPSFSIPRFGPGCPLWPLYSVLARPGQPEAARLDLPQGGLFDTWAVAQPVAQTGFGRAPVIQATMLIAPVPAPTPQMGDGAVAIPAGPGCHLCPRERCPARR
jgi:hypothetical protein